MQLCWTSSIRMSDRDSLVNSHYSGLAPNTMPEIQHFVQWLMEEQKTAALAKRHSAPVVGNPPR